MRASRLFESACAAGDLAGCSHLAPMYEWGEPLGRDLNKAIDLYTKTCDGGFPRDCHALAKMLLRGGISLRRDPARAIPLLEKACDRDVAVACRDLASMLERGDGITRNPSRARTLMAKACAGGDKEACAGSRTAR